MVLPQSLESLAFCFGDKRCRKGVLVPTFRVRPLVEPVETGCSTDENNDIRSVAHMQARVCVNVPVTFHHLDPELIAHALFSIGSDLPPGKRLLPFGALVVSDLALDKIFIGRQTLDSAAVPHGCTVEGKLQLWLGGSEMYHQNPVRMGDEHFPGICYPIQRKAGPRDRTVQVQGPDISFHRP